MPSARDPYRTLGLTPGATVDDVKKAYRRLAKANHPDTAGPAAIPRFLAIQEAYETLLGMRPNGTVPSDPGGTGAAGAPRAWEADPGRARASRESWQSRAGRRPPPPPSDGDADSAGGAAGRRRAGTSRGRSGFGRQRPPDRATPGSTSYDYAEGEPFDPEWSGASWYGPSSGTYWTINPREYADPRKHGPEYQARARRTAPNGRPEPDPEPTATEPTATEPTEPPAAEDVASARSETAPPGAEGRNPPSAAPRPRFVPPDTAVAPDTSAAAPPPPSLEDELLDSVRSAGATRSRVALALLAWPPIGLGLAFVLGELTGCGRFAATCVDEFALGTWVAQLAIILVLLVVPGLAAVAAVGTLATLAAAIPVAVLLSAAGGSRDPGTAGNVLAATLAVAWTVGVGIALARRSPRVST